MIVRLVAYDLDTFLRIRCRGVVGVIEPSALQLFAAIQVVSAERYAHVRLLYVVDAHYVPADGNENREP